MTTVNSSKPTTFPVRAVASHISSRRGINVALSVTVVSIAACTTATDAGMIPIDASASAALYSPWSAPVALGPIVNSPSNEQNAQLSKDGLTIYFSSDRPGGLGGLDIYVTQRTSVDSPWEVPINLGSPINSAAADFAPNVSIDGHLLFFASGRPGGFGGADIYVSRRHSPKDDFGWGIPVNVGQGINTTDGEQAPNYHQNAEAGIGNLYFNRGVLTANTADLYVGAVSRSGLALGPATAVAELNSAMNDAAAVLRHDGKEVFFFSNRAGGLGGNDIWSSTRKNVNASWSPPVNVGAPLNTPASDVTPNVSFDGLTLLLGTSRPGSVGGQDIWVSTRTRAP